MEASTPARVLVVAHRTAATPALLDAVRERAAAGPAAFTLLVPSEPHGIERVLGAPEQHTDEADAVLAAALPELSAATGGEVRGLASAYPPLEAIQDAVNVHGFDEIILSTLPAHLSRWLRIDLPHKVGGLGLPLTTVTAPG